MPRANFKTGLKVCAGCKIEQPLQNFYNSLGEFDRLHSHCKKCDRKRLAAAHIKNPTRRTDNARRKNYGISPEEVCSMKQTQQNKCPGCLREFSNLFREHIDHDHVTGKIRGILCGNCNSGMGLLKDDPAILLRLAAYLQVAKSANS